MAVVFAKFLPFTASVINLVINLVLFGGRFRFLLKKLRTENSLRHRSLFGTVKCF